MSEAMLCVRNGEVCAMVIIDDDEIFRETMAEWSADPATEAILKVPVEAAKAAFLQPAAGIISSLFPQPVPVPDLPGVTYEMITKLMEAVEGELDGLAIDAGQALAIMSHVMCEELPFAKIGSPSPQSKSSGGDGP